VVTAPPAPVVIPDFPKLKVQATTAEDEPAATRIAAQLRAAAIPMTSPDEHVTVTVTGGRVSLQGVVASQEEHNALIAAVQQAGGISAIYDRLQVG
jgi:osmotically-inducible protein OsmY